MHPLLRGVILIFLFPLDIIQFCNKWLIVETVKVLSHRFSPKQYITRHDILFKMLLPVFFLLSIAHDNIADTANIDIYLSTNIWKNL